MLLIKKSYIWLDWESHIKELWVNKMQQVEPALEG